MSIMERIFATLMLEMRDLEEFAEKRGNSDQKSDLKTQEVVIRYTLDGQDKFLVIDYQNILRLMESRAEGLRRELTEHGVLKDKKK